MKVLKTFRRRPGLLLNVLDTLSLHLKSMGLAAQIFSFIINSLFHLFEFVALPVTLKISGRRAIIIKGSDVSTRKVA